MEEKQPTRPQRPQTTQHSTSRSAHEEPEETSEKVNLSKAGPNLYATPSQSTSPVEPSETPGWDALHQAEPGEPWPGYNSMSVEQIFERLGQRHTHGSVVRAVLDFEKAHQNRPEIVVPLVNWNS